MSCTCPPEVRSGEAPVPDREQPHLMDCPEWVKPQTQHVVCNTAVVEAKAFGSRQPRKVPVDIIALNTQGHKVRVTGPVAARYVKALLDGRTPAELCAIVDEES